jgi:SAM-dependent methyltransferase
MRNDYQAEGDAGNCAPNWQRYWAGRVRGFVAGDVLAVGLGACEAALLGTERVHSVTCVEADRERAARLAGGGLAHPLHIIVGTTAELREPEAFDAVIYAGVVEQSADDRAELARGEWLLRPGGYLVVVCPAYPGLGGAGDCAGGKACRYTRRSLAAVAPAEMIRVRLRCLDSAGALLAQGRRRVGAEPAAAEVVRWDRYVVPVSRCLDAVTGYRVGRAVLGVWRKPPEQPVREFGGATPVAA